MGEDDDGYEPIGDSAPKPYSVRSMAAMMTLVSVTAAGVFCALYFTIGAVSHSTSIANLPFISDDPPIFNSLTCTSVPADRTGLQCAYYNSTRSYLCLDQNDAALPKNMAFVTQLDSFSFDSADAAAGDAMLCSEVNNAFACIYVATSLAYLGSELTSTINNDGMICTRTVDAPWFCLTTAQELTFESVASLLVTLGVERAAGVTQSDHNLGCLLIPDSTDDQSELSWQCGPLLNCIYQGKIGWACWGGNTTATAESSVPWFTASRGDLEAAELLNITYITTPTNTSTAIVDTNNATTTTSAATLTATKQSALSATVISVSDQMCYYHPDTKGYQCASVLQPDAVGLAAHFNKTLHSTYQVRLTKRDL